MIKDLEGVPKEIEHVDKSFMGHAMCDIFFNSIPGSFKDVYYSRIMTHFPIHAQDNLIPFKALGGSAGCARIA